MKVQSSLITKDSQSCCPENFAVMDNFNFTESHCIGLESMSLCTESVLN